MSDEPLSPDSHTGGLGVAIRGVQLTKTYATAAGGLTIFAGLDFEFAPGERIAVIGESGSGKSTLLHLLGALDRPSEGTVYYGSQNIFAQDDAALARFRNRAIGYVWQQHSLLPEFTALENVAMPLLIRGIPFSQAQAAARERLQETGLAARLSHRAGELSGGEQQRVALARALVHRPAALLADEPTGNLDYRTGNAIADLLDELHRLHRFTSIIVTHNLSFARRCDRILQLDKGRLDSAQPALLGRESGSPSGIDTSSHYV
jgi:lipoprotein-releasing system ATP-binding protein